MASAETLEGLNIPNRIERLPVTAFTWKIVIICGLAWFIESLSIGSMGVVVPVLQKVMKMSAGMTGLLVASSTFGIVLGLIPAGQLADRYGRKNLLFWGIVIYSAFTILCAVSTNYYMLFIFRFLSGLGMGAVFPLPYAMTGEFVNSRHRTLFNGLMDAALSIGYFIAPLLGFVILPHFLPNVSWRIFFVIAGVPLLYAFVVKAFLPESPRWLYRKGRYTEAEQIMSNIEKDVEKRTGRPLPAPAAETVLPVSTGKQSAGQPWTGRYLRRTVALAIAATGTFFMFYVVMQYMPMIFVKQGMVLAKSLLFTALITGVAIPGKLLNGFLGERLGRKLSYVIFMGIAGFGSLFFGLGNSITVMLIFGMVMSFFGTGAFPALKMWYAEQYPTHIRTTGAATVESIGRFLGGVVGSYLIPIILERSGLLSTFYVITAVTFVAVLVVVIFSYETAKATLEELEIHLAG